MPTQSKSKKWLIWAHSDQAGGMELACVIAKALIDVRGRCDEVAILAPKPKNITNFLEQEVIRWKDVKVIETKELLRIEKSPEGRVYVRATHDLLTRYPFDKRNNTFESLNSLIDDYKNQLQPICNESTLMISCGEPTALEVANRLKIKSVIVTDHLLTCSVRWVLRNGGLFDKQMAELFTLFEEYDRKADRAFLSPLEFASDDYVAYLGYGSMDCIPMGGLFYEPISQSKLEANTGYQNLKKAAGDYNVVFVFGGGGKLWFELYEHLQELAERSNPFNGSNIALLIPAMEKIGGVLKRKQKSSSSTYLYHLYTPDGQLKVLEDPGLLMYWYAGCHLFVGRGGLAAQQIFASMMSDMKSAPEMLFIEEPGHPQIEHERKSLYSLGFVHTRTLDAFRTDPINTIQDVLREMSPAQTRARVRVRYGKDMVKVLAQSLVDLYP